MYKRITYLFIYIFIYLTDFSQLNLVQNHSFEDILGNCSIQLIFHNNVDKWYDAKESPDYFNPCANVFAYPEFSTMPYNCKGYQLPRTGNAYGGLGLYYMHSPDSTNISSELIGTKLIQPLKPNTCYYGEFYISLAEISDVGINRIGMLFTQSTYTLNFLTYGNLAKPQIYYDTIQCFKDTMNWVKVSGTFMAQGGEEYLTIGNFRDGAHVEKQFLSNNFANICNIGNPYNISYLYIDDVALYELPTPQLQSNSITVCPGDSLLLGDTARIETTYKWFENGTQIATTSTITVKPTQNTTYVLQSTNCTTTTQSVIVTYSANCEPVVVVEPIIPNVFTPNNDSINDVWRFSLGKGNTLKELKIFNRWGIDLTPGPSPKERGGLQAQTVVLWDGRTTSGQETPAGVYFYVLQYTDANGEEHKKNGYVTLIR